MLIGDGLQPRNTISLGVFWINRHLHLYEVLTRRGDRRVRHGEVLQPATGIKITYHKQVMPIASHSKIKKCSPPGGPSQGVVAQQLRADSSSVATMVIPGPMELTLDPTSMITPSRRAYAPISSNIAPQLP